MRVLATSALPAVREAPAARRAGGAAFALADDAGAARRNTPVQLQAIGGIESLVALQGVDDATEKRRRAVRRGRGALDALDALKLGLVAGTLDRAALLRLREAAAETCEPTGESELDAVLAGIDLRVQVELAKLERR